MKVLIAIPTCHSFDYGKTEDSDGHVSGPNHRIQAIRDTWLTNTSSCSHLDVKFFYGRGSNRLPLADEVYLPVPDDYAGLPQKVIAICKWALSSGYDYLLKIDDDSYVWPDRLLAELKQQFDYAGWCHGQICSGGAGYWLSKRAMQAVIDFKGPLDWREDVHTAKCMAQADIGPIQLLGHTPASTELKSSTINRLGAWMTTLNGVTPEDMERLQVSLPIRPQDIAGDDVDQDIYPFAKRHMEPVQFTKFCDLMEKFLNEEHQPLADYMADRLGELLPELFDYFPHIYEDKAHGGLRNRRSEAMLEWANRS